MNPFFWHSVQGPQGQEYFRPLQGFIVTQESKPIPQAAWIMQSAALQHILRSSPYYLTGEQELTRATIHRSYLLEALQDLDFTLTHNPLFLEAVTQVELLLRWNNFTRGILYIGQAPSPPQSTDSE